MLKKLAAVSLPAFVHFPELRKRTVNSYAPEIDKNVGQNVWFYLQWKSANLEKKISFLLVATTCMLYINYCSEYLQVLLLFQFFSVLLNTHFSPYVQFSIRLG